MDRPIRRLGIVNRGEPAVRALTDSTQKPVGPVLGIAGGVVRW